MEDIISRFPFLTPNKNNNRLLLLAEFLVSLCPLLEDTLGCLHQNRHLEICDGLQVAIEPSKHSLKHFIECGLHFMRHTPAMAFPETLWQLHSAPEPVRQLLHLGAILYRHFLPRDTVVSLQVVCPENMLVKRQMLHRRRHEILIE